ncbi:transposase [Achromobacter sp. PD1]|uniref:transposase n=1 Tax=Achromobacter sp. PD1 TaxID=3399125 RepID=UPI003AF8FC69
MAVLGHDRSSIELTKRPLQADNSHQHSPRRAIGRQLGRSASTISREVGRNGGPGKCRAYDAEKQFLKRGLRPKPYLLSREPQLRSIVIRLLEADWSPEQILGWLKRHSPDGKIMCVSREAVHRSLFVQARGVLREELDSADPRQALASRGVPA